MEEASQLVAVPSALAQYETFGENHEKKPPVVSLF
jgi:hypothetical protein